MRSSHHPVLAASLLALLAGLAGLAVAALPATAGAAVPDPERHATTPTAWDWHVGLSKDQVDQRLKADGDRIVDLEVQSTAPYRFAVATVRNKGVYARDSNWYFGLTAAQLTAKLKEKNGRLIDIETYVAGGSRRFAAVAVRNSGEAAKSWRWYQGLSKPELASRLKQHSSRLVDLESYDAGAKTKYAAVMIRNSGVDRTGWWYWANAPRATVRASEKNNGARTFSLERLPNGRVNAIQVKSKGEFSVYEIDVSADRVATVVSQNAGRIVDLDAHGTGKQLGFTVVINDNADAFNARVRDLARAAPSLPVARFGFFVKQVGGPISVGLGADTVFEPASVMKTLHHLYLHTRLEADPPEDLNAVVQFPDCTTFRGATGECNAGKEPREICPTREGVTEIGTMTLDAADRAMMADSDNRTTFAIEQRYGRATLNVFAASIGATSTKINDTLGCWNPETVINTTTLVDLSRMIEGASNGSLLRSDGVRNRFFDTLIQGSSVSAELQAIVAQEALAARKNIGPEFVDSMVYRAKGGRYGQGRRAAVAAFGRILIPFKVDGQVRQRAFAFGSFFNCLICNGDLQVIGAYGSAATEMFRAAIRSAIATW